MALVIITAALGLGAAVFAGVLLADAAHYSERLAEARQHAFDAGSTYGEARERARCERHCAAIAAEARQHAFDAGSTYGEARERARCERHCAAIAAEARALTKGEDATPPVIARAEAMARGADLCADAVRSRDEP
jgi:hypothetical protein